MPVEGISSSPMNACFGPNENEPQVDTQKKDEKKQLDANAAASRPAGASQQKSVVAFAAPRIRLEEDPQREVAEKTGKDVLSKSCAVATTSMGALAAAKLGASVPVGAVVGGAVSAVVSPHCEPGGAMIGGAIYDVATGGPYKLNLTTQTIEVPVGAGSDARATTTGASGSPSKLESTRPSTSAPEASSAPSTPASTAAKPDFTDPNASYLRNGANATSSK
jgi:hypothetical protein